MNRNQFLILTALSAVVTFCLLVQILLVKVLQHDQVKLAESQQTINQAQSFMTQFKRLAQRTGQLSVTTGDQGLKDLLARQNITIAPSATNAPSATPDPSATPTR